MSINGNIRTSVSNLYQRILAILLSRVDPHRYKHEWRESPRWGRVLVSSCGESDGKDEHEKESVCLLSLSLSFEAVQANSCHLRLRVIIISQQLS